MYKISNSNTVTIINKNNIRFEIIITTTIISISKIIKTTNNLTPSKLTLLFHTPNPQLKLPQVLTLINPPNKSNNINKTPHITTPNTPSSRIIRYIFISTSLPPYISYVGKILALIQQLHTKIINCTHPYSQL